MTTRTANIRRDVVNYLSRYDRLQDLYRISQFSEYFPVEKVVDEIVKIINDNDLESRSDSKNSFALVTKVVDKVYPDELDKPFGFISPSHKKYWLNLTDTLNLLGKIRSIIQEYPEVI